MNRPARVAIFGTAGHAQDIAACLQARDPACEIAYISAEDEAAQVQTLRERGYRFIIGIGDNALRARLAQRYAELDWTVAVDPRAQLPAGMTLEPGVFIGFGVYVSHHVHIGQHAIVHANSVIGHDAQLGPFSQVAPGVCIGGNGVVLGEGAFVGANATIINKPLRIGAWAVVGMAGVVAENVPDHHLFQTVHKRMFLQLQSGAGAPVQPVQPEQG